MNKTSGLQICITSLLQNCKSLTSLKQIHAYACKTSLLTDPFIAGKFLLICTSILSHALQYAFGIFRQFPNPDIFMYNTLMRGQSESEAPDDAMITYIEMRRNGQLLSISPDSFSFAFSLKAASRFGSLKLGIQLHSEALRHGLNSHLFVGTTLVSMYGECGSLNNAKTAFAEMCHPNVVAWNAVLNAYFRCGDVKGAELTFGKMGLQNLTSWNIMLAGYMKAGEIELARELFGMMVIRDDVSWSTMIIGFAHEGCFEQAFWCFRELVKVGIRPNEVSLTGVLTACAQAGAFEFGKIVHGLIEKAGFNRIVSVNNALLDAYCRCGNVGMAQLVFEGIVGEKNVVSWTSMMAGLAMYGYGDEAIQLFQLMEESGVRPDGITFISILYACSHAGLTEPGSRYFHDMKEVYGIEPAIEHYGCMVDMYGRAGQLEKAYEFVTEMPIPPTDVIWRILLGACSVHGNVELAQRVKERLSELDPENSGDHVLLSNIYAVAGKWKDAATVRRSMTHQRIKKEPGWSVIEVDKSMYSFIAGLRENEATVEAYEKLKEIMLQLRVQGGYFPETGNGLQDIEDEEKENAVTTHSEKLAIAFGMARLCKGSTIRIVKNLRICKDCHTVMKLISKVYGIHIVVRDRSRFHSFKDGVCSCSDYW